MAIVKSKPTSPGRRGLISIKSDLYKGKPHKSLTQAKAKKGGRNNNGRITVRHKGGGHKQHYRVIDFKRNKFDIPATVELNMIQIELLTLHFLNILMVKGDILLLLLN